MTKNDELEWLYETLEILESKSWIVLDEYREKMK